MSSIPFESHVARSDKTFSIRTAQPDDAAMLLDYIRPLAAATTSFIMEPDEFPKTEAEERAWVADHLEHPGRLALVAEAEGQIIGNLGFENGPFRRVAHRGAFGISVVERWRGLGVGTALLRALIDWATANPLIEKIELEVFATNPSAICLYKKLGFVEEGLRCRNVKLGPENYVDTLAMYRFV